jgi:NAD-dependent dihydropyrimidine dehydrogenase PreA subunit
MPAPAAHNLRVVLYEGKGSAELESRKRFEVVSSLLEAGYPVTRVVSGGEVAPPDSADVAVFGHFEGEPPVAADKADVRLHFYDFEQLDNLDCVAVVEGLRERIGAERPGQWTPWFPVIDYERCTNCMQCLSFCLFDVYAVDGDDQITVQKESNCKTNCPACSRVCPEAAIMFPKYQKSPINGDRVRSADLANEAMKVDISALLGGDLYARLRSRQGDARKRFSTERDESKALLERKRCLKKLKKNLDIPDEVLMTLPSAGDIEERTRRAREKHARRLARSQTVRDEAQAPMTEEDWGI